VQSLWTLGHFVAAAALVCLANWLGLIPWRRAAHAHWAERARLLWPARATAVINIFILPIALPFVQRLVWPGATDAWLLHGGAAALGALAGSYPFDRELYPRLTPRDWLHQVAAGWSLQLGYWALFILAIIIMPREFGWGVAAVAGGFFAISVGVQWGVVLTLLRWMRIVKPPSERLSRIAGETSARMKVPARGVWLLGGLQALAFALPTTRELLFSERLMEICTDEEVAAVCAHELGHLTESKATLAGRLVGALSPFPLVFLNPATHALGAVALLLLLLAVLGIARLARWLSLRMEKRADAMAAKGETEEGVYARALEKIHRENQLPAVVPKDRLTHPHLYDRMVTAGIAPDFERPKPPSKMTWVGVVYLVGFGVLVGVHIGRTLGR